MSFDMPLTPPSRILPRGTPPIKLDLPSIVPLDEPPINGITIQPPTALLEDIHLEPVIHTAGGVRRPSLNQIPSTDAPLHISPVGSTGSARISPSTRHPLSRALSPDLPTRDALYLFSNFSSYMRSPNEGPGGIISNEDFKDTVRLLDFARASSLYHIHWRKELMGRHWSNNPTPTSTSYISNIDSNPNSSPVNRPTQPVIGIYQSTTLTPGGD
jgi:hypothetical protein